MTNLSGLVIGSGWRETLNNAFTTLRRINFTTKEDFNNWLDWAPMVKGGAAMTITATTVQCAKYLKINQTVWIHLYLSGVTTGGVASSRIVITPPFNKKEGTTATFAGTAIDGGGVIGATGLFQSLTNDTTIAVRKYDAAGWSGGPIELTISGFYQANI